MQSTDAHPALEEYRSSLQEFVDKEAVRSFSTPIETGGIDVPENHLRELGYME